MDNVKRQYAAVALCSLLVSLLSEIPLNESASYISGSTYYTLSVLVSFAAMTSCYKNRRSDTVRSIFPYLVSLPLLFSVGGSLLSARLDYFILPAIFYSAMTLPVVAPRYCLVSEVSILFYTLGFGSVELLCRGFSKLRSSTQTVNLYLAERLGSERVVRIMDNDERIQASQDVSEDEDNGLTLEGLKELKVSSPKI